MYPRVLERKNKDGTARQYLYLVESKREKGKVVQKNVASLGRLDNLQQSQKIDDLVKRLAKFCEKNEILNLEKDLNAESGKELGMTYIYRELWKKLGFDKVLNKYYEDKEVFNTASN